MIVLDDFLDEEAQKAVDHIVRLIDFNIFNPVADVSTELQFTKTIVDRPENIDNSHKVDPDYVEFFIRLFNIFMSKCGFDCEYNIHRISVNANVATSVKESAIHKDHTFPHKQLIICMNDDFEGGATKLYDDDMNLIDIVESKKYRGYSFDWCNHSIEYPKSGIRVVAVYTFSLD